MTDTAIDNAGATNPGTTGAEGQQSATLLGSAGQQQEQAQNTLLGGQQQEQQQQEQAQSTPEKYAFPEKFQVKAGDEVDFDASVRKLGEAYSQLEKRFGSGEARPADVTGYKFDEAFGAEFGEKFLADPNAQEFMKQAHEMGLNNKQLNFFIKEMIAAQPSQAEVVTGFTPEQAQTELQKTWADPASFRTNMSAADRAARHLLKDDYAPFIQRYGNDPSVIRLLARVGSEMGEDALRLAGTPSVSPESLEDMMASEAYRNDKHPDHRRVVQQVRTFFERTYGTNDIV